MFGLGWIEIAVIGAVISFIAGPTVLRRVVGQARQLHQLKNGLTGPAMLDRLMGEEPPSPDGTGEAEPDDDATA
ncbi:MAG: hypothetical protein AB8I08_28190 [Sandaracinaceae bacterium]